MQKLQLDNQMVDAVQPVVLAPMAQFRPTAPARATDAPLVTFHFVRSYAGSGGEGGGGGEEGGGGGGSGPPSPGKALEEKQGIKSFKDIRLCIGALDLMTGGCWWGCAGAPRATCHQAAAAAASLPAPLA